MKIFCIGLSRTGTKSLTKALQILGFNAGHYVQGMQAVISTEQGLRLDRASLDRWDALADLPIAHFYQQLDVLFPGSRFIHTVRELDSWLGSCSRHFNRTHDKHDLIHGIDKDKKLALRKEFYGTMSFDQQQFEQAYHRHTRQVHQYFQARPEDLLTMNIPAGDGWEILCPFLGMPEPHESFPHLNKQERGAP